MDCMLGTQANSFKQTKKQLYYLHHHFIMYAMFLIFYPITYFCVIISYKFFRFQFVIMPKEKPANRSQKYKIAWEKEDWAKEWLSRSKHIKVFEYTFEGLFFLFLFTISHSLRRGQLYLLVGSNLA